VLQRTQNTKRLVLRRADRCLWVWLSQLWSGWRSALVIVKPETAIAWHRQGFRRSWTWKIRHGRTGRPGVSKETRDLIQTMSRMNVLWGAPRSRVEHWRGDPKEAPCLCPAFPPSCPFRSFRNPVSSARHVARSRRISRTTRSCTLHIKGYETYRTGTAFDRGRTR
jgi:hypothetical protein